MSVLQITGENFESEVLNEGKVLVDFYADWCGPCKMMSPIIDDISEEKSDIKVCKINVDEAQELAIKYNVMSIPTIMIFENGNVVKQFVGVTSKGEIMQEL